MGEAVAAVRRDGLVIIIFSEVRQQIFFSRKVNVNWEVIYMINIINLSYLYSN